jgi:uncharacterized protein (DUF2062 family)
MDAPPRICAVIPVFNHGLTVRRVAAAARRVLPVIVVNDGSTDQTAAQLPEEQGLTVLTLPHNQGKAAALRAGFAKAAELGYTHAVTMDADGQHLALALPEFVAACQQQPEAFIIGVRDLRQAGAPWARRASNALSTFWFRFETGLRLPDTQCGYRCYPLALVRQLHLRAGRYAWELEVMVKAAWAGYALAALPVAADYAAPTSRLSHFRPGRDMLQMSWLHSCLATQAFCVPALLRRGAALGTLRALPRGQRLRVILRELYSENTETPARLAGAVALGLFCGIAPIWGFQMAAAAFLAHRARLNKAIALTASNISFPLAAPFILAAGLVLGHFLWTGGLVEFRPEIAARQIPLYLWEWILGSVVLAAMVGLSGGLAAWVLARLWARDRRPAPAASTANRNPAA